MKKGMMVTYRSGLGSVYSARVARAHRDGTATVQVRFHLNKDGSEAGCFYSDKFRVDRVAIDTPPDPRDPDPSKPGIFRNHSCWACKDGEKPCRQGAPNRCEYPRARND